MDPADDGDPRDRALTWQVVAREPQHDYVIFQTTRHRARHPVTGEGGKESLGTVSAAAFGSPSILPITVNYLPEKDYFVPIEELHKVKHSKHIST